MTNFRGGYLEQGQPLGQNIGTVNLTADSLNVNPTGLGVVRLYSDSTVASDRDFTIDDSTLIGQELTLVLYSGGGTTCRLIDVGNVILAGTWTPSQYDSLQLYWDGRHWVETSRTASASEFNPVISGPLGGNILVYNQTNDNWENKIVSGAITMDEDGVTTLGALTIPLTDGNILIGDPSNDAKEALMSGDVTISNVGVTSISSGAIVDDDINAAAAIQLSKLEALTSGNIVLGDVSNIATSTPVTGVIAIDSLGVTSLSPSSVTLSSIYQNVMLEISGTLTQSQILNLVGTPVTAIPSPGAGSEILVYDIEIQHVYANAIYTGAGNLTLQYSSGDSICSFAGAIVGAGTSAYYFQQPNNGITPVVVTSANNSVIQWINTGGGFVGGDPANVINYRIRYRIVSTTF